MQQITTKDYSELELSNSFIFAKVMQDEHLCKQLLEIILDIDILKLEYIETEKAFEFAPDSRGVRLDAYVNDDKGTIYDIEMQSSDTKELPKRSRYYQSMIDSGILEKGIPYKDLKKSYVIFICMSDVFNGGLYKYTFRNVCIEDTSIELKDEATKIFLNPNGKGPINVQLSEFLEYLREHKTNGEFSQALDQSVTSARHNALWRKEYMTLQQEILNARYEALEEGREEGRAERDALKAKNDELKARLAELQKENVLLKRAKQVTE